MVSTIERYFDGISVPASFPGFPGGPPPVTTGFTSPVPSLDTRMVYVDQVAGIDTNPGTRSLPVKTVAKGKSLLRPGFPDWLCLKRGKTWNEAFGNWITAFGTTLSGRSATERMVICAYGSGARPKIRSGVFSGFKFTGGSSRLQYLYILDIDFQAEGYNASGQYAAGVDLSSHHDYVHVENCVGVGMHAGVYCWNGTQSTNLVVRRNEFMDMTARTDNGGPLGSCYGVFLGGYQTGALVEENYIDSISPDLGTNPAAMPCGIDSNQSGLPPIVRRNLIARCGARGANLGAGGQVYQNVFLQCPYGVVMSPLPGEGNPGGFAVDLNGNLFIEGKDTTVTSGATGGTAILLRNVGGGQVVSNIVTQNTATYASKAALVLDGSDVDYNGGRASIKNLSVALNKVFRWGMGAAAAEGLLKLIGTNPSALDHAFENVAFNQNDLQESLLTTGNLITIPNANVLAELTSSNFAFQRGGAGTWFQIGSGSPVDLTSYLAQLSDSTSVAGAASYSHATRTIGDYHASIGGTGTTAAFLTACRAQEKATWNDLLLAENILAYFAANFAP